MSVTLQVTLGLALPWLYTGLDRLIALRFPGWTWYRWNGLGRELTFSAIGAAAALAIGRDWAGVIAAGVMAIVGAVIWWHRQKKRRRAAAVLGAKSKALREALVRRARQAARPRPVLRPAPGGAR